MTLDIIIAAVVCGLLVACLLFFAQVQKLFKETSYRSFLLVLILTFVYALLEICLRVFFIFKADPQVLLMLYSIQSIEVLGFLGAIPLFLQDNLKTSVRLHRVFHTFFLLGIGLILFSLGVTLLDPNLLITQNQANLNLIEGRGEPQKGAVFIFSQGVLFLYILSLAFFLLLDMFRWKSFKQARVVAIGALLALFFEISALFKSLMGFNLDPFYMWVFSRVIVGLGIFAVFTAWGFFKIFLLRAREMEEARDKMIRSQAALQKSFVTDELTQVANRQAFILDLDEQLKLYPMDPTRRASVCLFDLDGFRDLNESFGNDTGDRVLIAVSRAVEVLLPVNAKFYRLGADEFAILLVNNPTEDQAVGLMKMVQARLLKGIKVDGETFYINCSMGISFVPESGATRKQVLSSAFNVARQAKAQRSTIQLYSPDNHEESIRRIQTANALRQDLRKANFYMVYQPITDSDGKIVSAEALIRWRVTNDLCFSSPAQFIPIAESAGLMIELGGKVLDMVLTDLGPYLDLPGFPHVHVNLSPSQLYVDNFNEQIKNKFEALKISPHKIIFEVTESMFMDQSTDTLKKLQGLKDLGCGVTIDDFGSGYSSLGYLQNLPVDGLKLDQTFLTTVPGNKSAETLVEAVASIARAFGLTTVAEGVERQDQLDFLKRKGFHQYQGYFFYKPLEKAQLFKALGIEEKM